MRDRLNYIMILLFLVTFAGSAAAADRITNTFYFKTPYLAIPATIYTITSDDIQNFGITKISDILKYFGNVIILPSDRHLDRIYIRGIGSKYNDRILLMINGIPIHEPVYQHAFIDEYIPIENIKSVELIIGPTSAFFGTNSLAGAINIITYPPEERNFRKIGGIIGEDATKGLYVRGNIFKSDKIELNYFAKYYSSQGEGPGKPASKKYSTLFLNNDPSEIEQFQTALLYKNLKLDINYTEFKNKFTVGYDFPPWQTTFFRYKALLTDADYRRKLSENTFFECLIYDHYFNDDNLWYKFNYTDTGHLNYTIYEAIKPIKVSNVFGNSTRIFYAKRYKGIKHQVVAGYRIESHDIKRVFDSNYNTDGRIYKPYYIPRITENVFSLFGGYTLYMKKFSAVLNYRIDHHNEFGFIQNPRVFFSYRPTDRPLYLKFMIGEAYRTPTARELHTIVKQDFHQGNPALTPERLVTPELTISYIKPRIRSDFTIFHNKFWDFIQPGPSDTSFYVNKDKGENYGAEWNSLLFFPHNKINIYISYINGEDTTLHTIPKFKFSLLHSLYLTKYLTLSTSYQYYSEFLKNEKRLPAVFLINAFLSYDNNKSFLKISLENILNKTYALPPVKLSDNNYTMSGRKIYFSLGFYL